MGSVARRRVLVAVGILVAVVLTVVIAGSGQVTQPSSASAGRSEGWVGTWAAAQAAAGAGLSGKGFTDQTLRMTVRTSVGGEALRVRLSNSFGAQAVRIGRATVGLPVANDSPQVDPKTMRELTFNGLQAVSIPKGGQVLTDAVTLAVPALRELTVSVYLPEATGPTTFHLASRETSFIGAGNQVTRSGDFAVSDTRPSWFFLSGVDVQTRKANGSVVVIGDSITDGNGSTLGLHRRWPDYLASRLAEDMTLGDSDPSILNQGMAGNAVTHDGTEIGFAELGVNALARFYRDVPGQTGVHNVIVALGINDIQAYDDPTDRIVEGLRQLAAQAQQLGLRVVGATLTPFEGFQSWTPGKEVKRMAVNAYLRDSRLFDAIVDFDQVLRDPEHPSKLQAELDSGDHIHPNDAGAEQLAKAVPLDLLYPAG